MADAPRGSFVKVLLHLAVSSRASRLSRETLINSEFVIPANAGIQEIQRAGHRRSPV